MAQSGLNVPKALSVGDMMKDDLKRFRQEVNIYFEASETVKKPMRTQVACLLNFLGSEALRIYNTLKVSKEDHLTVNKILDAFEKYCEPRKNLVVEHYKLFNKRQGSKESFDQFHMALKQDIQSCEFGVVEEIILKSMVVIGLYNKDTQLRLMKEDMTLNKTLRILVSFPKKMVSKIMHKFD